MERGEAAQQIDRLLLPYLQATEEHESSRILAQLVDDHAEPIIKSIISRKLQVSFSRSVESRSSEDAEELRSEVLVQLLSRLNELKEKRADKHINNFRGYVAATTYSAWHEHLRQKYPQRHMLKNRLRYLLTHRVGFAVWAGDDDEALCGLIEWQNQRKAVDGARRIQELRSDPQPYQRAGLSPQGGQRLDLASLIAALFRYSGACVPLDDLVNVVAEWTGVSDQKIEAGTEEDEVQFDQLPDPRETVETDLERRMYLQRVWTEIRLLRPQQRAAILLNLRDADGGDVVSVLPIAGIATVNEIADAVAIPVEQLVALWNDLPLEDLAIADRLGVTRQQVINLRKSGRERLARRMKGF